uniref:Uncharacterized protein LOC113784535 n=1 Tax=Cicer arietinum TaxID=3827 RepID=A0A3Q7Y6Y9_CICAR|nr:uncharacterized protein LOC113784535 [Cicer arietinum]
MTLLVHKKPIDVKWVYKIKLKPDEHIARYKARLVAKGFLQIPRLDYDEVLAPVARIETVRLVVSMASYKDDLLLTDSNEAKIHEFKIRIEKEFEMKDLGKLSYFLGIEFVVKENGIFMHQKKYANDVLACLVLSKEGNEERVDSTTFNQLVGSLRYLCNTRLDIAYSVGMVSRYMERPRTPRYLAAKRILMYIKHTK